MGFRYSPCVGEAGVPNRENCTSCRNKIKFCFSSCREISLTVDQMQMCASLHKSIKEMPRKQAHFLSHIFISCNFCPPVWFYNWNAAGGNGSPVFCTVLRGWNFPFRPRCVLWVALKLVSENKINEGAVYIFKMVVSPRWVPACWTPPYYVFENSQGTHICCTFQRYSPPAT